MFADIPTSPAGEVGPVRLRVLVAVCVAAAANALVPAVFFSVTRPFGQVNLMHCVLIVVVVLIEYAIAFLVALFHVHVGLASGYAVATVGVFAYDDEKRSFNRIHSANIVS